MKSVSIGFGVFMGIFPIWGFQMLVAIAVSIFYKLNKALVILAANISIPPMMPLILYASHAMGKIWMGDKAQSISFEDDLTLDLVHNHFVQYVAGAVTLAVIAGFAAGLISWVAFRVSKRRHS